MASTTRLALALLVSMPLAACGGGGAADDVAAVCGDGTVTAPEECDDGNTTAGDGCDDSCMNEPPAAYRVDTMEVRDPHMFALGTVDVTDTVNGAISDGLTMDADTPPDGKLDLSLVLLFRPINPTAASGRADAVVGAACAPPATSTSCMSDPAATVVESTATNGDATCLEPAAGTTGGYNPPVGTPAGRCFVTDKEVVNITVGGVQLMLQDAQIAATYGPGAPDTLTSGLLIGFISQAAADATILPADLPVVGGDPLSSLLKAEDQDAGPGGQGWWFYINFTAGKVPYTE